MKSARGFSDAAQLLSSIALSSPQEPRTVFDFSPVPTLQIITDMPLQKCSVRLCGSAAQGKCCKVLMQTEQVDVLLLAGQAHEKVGNLSQAASSFHNAASWYLPSLSSLSLSLCLVKSLYLLPERMANSFPDPTILVVIILVDSDQLIILWRCAHGVACTEQVRYSVGGAVESGEPNRLPRVSSSA